MEIWKELTYDGVAYPRYEVSTCGRIRNSKTKLVRSTYVDRRGYECVTVYISSENGKKIYASIKMHRAVAIAFIPNPENKETVNHIDGNKLNNYVGNLEWNTLRENHFHSMQVLGNKDLFSKTMKTTFSKAVIQMTMDGVEIKKWDSCREVERVLGFAHENIAACARGKRKTAYGYAWQYVDG